MDIGSRNDRLCETLQALGLFVVPVMTAADPTRIAYLKVSVSLPEQATENTAGRTVSSPVASPVVRPVINAAENRGHNVIDLPAVVRVQPVI